LLGNYPNPFNPSTNIHFQLATAAETTINIYDINGRLVDDMTPGTLSEGYHSIHWDAHEIPAGAYMIQLVAGDESAVRKCMLLK
jgi:flagellar hook assembly protein FlgD